MNCQQTKDLMKPFLDGTLDRNTMRRLRGHLADCKECASRLDPVDLMEILPVIDESIEPSEGFSDRFYAKLGTRKKRNFNPDRSPETGRKRSWLPQWSWGLAAAAVLTVVVATGLYVRRYEHSAPDSTAVLYDIGITENLPLLKDMGLFSNMELFENLDAIENLPQ